MASVSCGPQLPHTPGLAVLREPLCHKLTPPHSLGFRGQSPAPSPSMLFLTRGVSAAFSPRQRLQPFCLLG